MPESLFGLNESKAFFRSLDMRETMMNSEVLSQVVPILWPTLEMAGYILRPWRGGRASRPAESGPIKIRGFRESCGWIFIDRTCHWGASLPAPQTPWLTPEVRRSGSNCLPLNELRVTDRYCHRCPHIRLCGLAVRSNWLA